MYSPRRHKPEAPTEPIFRLPCGHGTVSVLVEEGRSVYSVICYVCSTDYNIRHDTVVRSDGAVGHKFRRLTGPST
jgi:transcription elongation factor Elf1